ncbi:MAG: hypothetical protein ABW137_00225 [Mycobacterium sp.]
MRTMRALFAAEFVVAASALAVAASPTAAAIPGYLACPPGDEYQLDIRGDVTCEYAATVASAYEWEGDKYQDLYEFTCYSAQYDVYPVVLTCVRGDDEVVVSEV